MSETNIFDDLFQMFINDINDVMVRVLASNTISLYVSPLAALTEKV
jgi:hypothetical protein